MTYPKDIKISAPEQFALLNDPDFLNQAITRFLQQFMEAEITSFLQAEPYQRTGDRIRSAGQVACEGVLIVSGISESGHCDILAIDVAHTETEAMYASLFKDLKKRGLKGVHLAISDHHEGLQNAIKRHFQGASWQHCQTHFHRNIKGLTPPKHQREVA